MVDVGFDIADAYGTHLRDPWTSDSPEIVVVARKR
jgi:hypothetical protein